MSIPIGCFDLEKLAQGDKTIKIEVDGRKVTGSIIFLSSSGFAIEIDNPYKNIRAASLHIPYFAMPRKSRWYADSNGLTDRGRSIAEDLLRDIYLIIRYVEKNLDIFIEAHQIFSELFDELYPDRISDDEYSERKAPLKKKFKRGEFSQKEYMAELKKHGKLKQQNFSYKFELIWELRNYLKEVSGIHVCEITCRDLIQRYIYEN